MPSTPQPCASDNRFTSHCGNEPLVATEISFPFRSPTFSIFESAAVITEKLLGAPAIAATPRIGEPLTANTKLVPPASPISTLPATSACCSFASPVRVEISASMPYLAKKPSSAAISTGTIAQITSIALPARTLSAA